MPLQKMSGIFDTVSWNCWWQSELMVRSNLSYWYDPPPSPFCSPPRVWKTSGERVDVGREGSVWLEQYQSLEGYKIIILHVSLSQAQSAAG